MMQAFQLLGALAIVLGLLGTWLAGHSRVGWVVCIVSSALWLPALTTADQWAAVVNCALSVAICVRNFRTGGGTGPQPVPEIEHAFSESWSR